MDVLQVGKSVKQTESSVLVASSSTSPPTSLQLNCCSNWEYTPDRSCLLRARLYTIGGGIIFVVGAACEIAAVYDEYAKGLQMMSRSFMGVGGICFLAGAIAWGLQASPIGQSSSVA